ncbi:MAG: hypothetical protein KJ559_00875, partial [Nanoarchaeota archaeon]|nr:hypothetical protein [Nanoarchaeota archaeon]
RKNASILINHLIEYNQRQEIAEMQKGKMKLKTKDKTYDLAVTSKEIFLIDSGNISKISKDKFVESNVEELTKALSEQKEKLAIDEKVFEIIKKKIGDFEITF